MQENCNEIYQQNFEHKLHFTYRNWKNFQMAPEVKMPLIEKVL